MILQLAIYIAAVAELGRVTAPMTATLYAVSLTMAWQRVDHHAGASISHVTVWRAWAAGCKPFVTQRPCTAVTLSGLSYTDATATDKA